MYYDESILLALAAAIGTPIRVDSTMLDVRRGSVCVKIDLDKPVIEKVWLEGFSSIRWSTKDGTKFVLVADIMVI